MRVFEVRFSFDNHGSFLLLFNLLLYLGLTLLILIYVGYMFIGMANSELFVVLYGRETWAFTRKNGT
jgi:hypothetical protein